MHKLIITIQKERPYCDSEGCNNLVKKGKVNKAGIQLYYTSCGTCCYLRENRKKQPYKPMTKEQRARARANYKRKKYNGYVKLPNCEHCNFVVIHSSQLDIDHIDGNRENNSPQNLQTLCANCHRLKT